MSVPAHTGDEADSAWRWGYVVSSADRTGITRSCSGRPTCTCTPQMSICRPHHWVRLISSS